MFSERNNIQISRLLFDIGFVILLYFCILYKHENAAAETSGSKSITNRLTSRCMHGKR